MQYESKLRLLEIAQVPKDHVRIEYSQLCLAKHVFIIFCLYKYNMSICRIVCSRIDVGPIYYCVCFSYTSLITITV